MLGTVLSCTAKGTVSEVTNYNRKIDIYVDDIQNTAMNLKRKRYKIRFDITMKLMLLTLQSRL